MDAKSGWVVWWWLQAGNDGRRPSGTVHQKSKAHYLDEETGKTLCGREPNLWTSKAEDNIPHCQRCHNAYVRLHMEA